LGKGQVSVGDDTGTGEPENGPKGPYITEDDDGTPRGKRPDKRPLPTRTKPTSANRASLAATAPARAGSGRRPIFVIPEAANGAQTLRRDDSCFRLTYFAVYDYIPMPGSLGAPSRGA
jgi:hypothetical protein